MSVRRKIEGDVSVSAHAIARFRQRSEWFKIDEMGTAQIRRLIRSLVHKGETVHRDTKDGKMQQIKKICHGPAKIPLYLFVAENAIDGRSEVVTVYTEDMHQKWQKNQSNQDLLLK